MPYTDPEKRKEYHRNRYHSDPVFRAKVLARSKRRSREYLNSYRKEWRKRPHVKAKERAYLKKFRERHRLLLAERCSRWRALNRNNAIGTTDYAEIIRLANGICGICMQPLSLPIEIDHIIPLARGGSHDMENLQATHRSCNRRKSSKLPEELGRR